jgi:hypothetical protein
MPLLTPDDYTNFPEVAPDFTVAYGDHPLQFGDLYLPQSTAPHPIVILIHGGCYREQYNLKPLGNICNALTAEGFAVWNIEYRRTGNGGDYPNMFLDVAQSADHLRQLANTHNLNLDKVITLGHSAGGHIALWLAGRHKIPNSSDLYISNPLPIQNVIVLAGVVDAVHAIENGICEGSLSVMMGGEPDTVPANYKVGDPRGLLPIGIPQTHIIGELDTEMMENFNSYHKVAKQTGDAIECVIPSGAGHFEIVDVSSEAWQAVHNAIVVMR